MYVVFPLGLGLGWCPHAAEGILSWIVLFWGYLEVPDVHQVQQGLQDVPSDSDCVWGEVRTLGRRAPLGAVPMMATLCMVVPALVIGI